jgi:hypothetical protein
VTVLFTDLNLQTAKKTASGEIHSGKHRLLFLGNLIPLWKNTTLKDKPLVDAYMCAQVVLPFPTEIMLIK